MFDTVRLVDGPMADVRLRLHESLHETVQVYSVCTCEGMPHGTSHHVYSPVMARDGVHSRDDKGDLLFYYEHDVEPEESP